MATNFTLTLDTTGPGSPTVVIEGGASFSGDNTVDLTTISTSDGDTTGYQMKIYGDVDDTANQSQYRATEVNAPWISFAASKTGIVLSSGDGSKTVKIKIRDDVLNPSSEATDSITVDTTLPVPNISTAPDVSKVSKQATKDTCTFSFEVSQDVEAWEVMVVPSAGSTHAAGTLIATAHGSTNTSGATLVASTPQQVVIKGEDLEDASAGDGDKVVKVFGQDPNTHGWSS